jgi:hypothetical protein
MTALQKAVALAGDRQTAAPVRVLLKHGADVDHVSQPWGHVSLLAIAVKLASEFWAQSGQVSAEMHDMYCEVASALLRAGASTSTGAHSPLVLAARGGSEAVVRLLLQAGARSSTARHGHDALLHACMASHLGVARLLLSSRHDQPTAPQLVHALELIRDEW